MEQDEDNNENRKRYEKLGFRPQKENVYNKLLPYSERLDDESTKLFQEIKTNLVKSVLAREMRPGCALWGSRLNKYMKIYGMKFSKQDHILLIQLFYEMFTIPDLEPTRINKCANTLTQLLKKKYLISRDELQLAWRPLYDLCVRVMEKSKTDIGMYRCFSNLESTVMGVIRLARIYFPAAATQEILDEFRPRLSPLTLPTIVSAIEYLEVFLPVCVKPSEASISYNLWFDDFMSLWNNCYNASTWEDEMMWLMARLSNYNMGQINWEPHIPIMFARFSRSFQLPIAYKGKQSGKQHKMEIGAIALWIVSTLNGDKSATFYHLEKLMQQIESYFYPANFGRWTIKLRELLRKLAYFFVQRVHYERFKKISWEPKVPEAFRLTDEDIDRFVILLRPCLEQAMFSRQGSQDIGLAMQYLASLRPNLIIPMTLDKLYAAMDSLTEPHKLTSSMMGVTAVARYMVQGAKSQYPEGATHVMPLLMALLPGIDPNDIRKCLVTFNFMVHFINMIPLINSSDAHNYYQDLTEEEHLVCEATAGFEDFVMQFFDRLFIWVESNSLDFVRLEQMANDSLNQSTKNRMEMIAESALFSVISGILHQCSAEIFSKALKKVYNFATSRIMEIQISGKMMAIICQGFAKVRSKETLKLFMPYLCETIEKSLKENVNIQKEEHLDVEFLYTFQILSEIVDARSELLVYKDRIIGILDKTLNMSALSGSQLAARLLEVLMSSLTFVLPTEFRSSATPYNTNLSEFLSIREWGKAQKIHELKMNWYEPGEREIEMVRELLSRYLLPQLEKLNSYAEKRAVLTRDELRRSLKIVISILSAHPVFPIWEEEAIELIDSVLTPWAFNLIVSNSQMVSLPNDGGNVRKVVAETMHKVQKTILELDEGDTKSIQNIVHVYNILLFNKSRPHDFEYQWKNFHIVKKLLEDRLHQNKLHLRHILINRVLLQQEFRIESRSCSFTKTHKQILLDLFELSVSRYSETRIAAQNKLFSVISYFPYSYTVLEPKIVETLQIDSQLNHEQFKGCLYTLISPKSCPIVARHDWKFVKSIWPLIVKSKPSEKPSIVNLISCVVDAVNRFFPTIAINLIFSDHVIEVAKKLAETTPKCNLDNFQNVIDNSGNMLKLKCEQRKEWYNGTVNGLLSACLDDNLHWRYHSMATTFLKILVHYDVKYNVKVIKYFLDGLIDDSIVIRKTALRVILFALIQNKPKFSKIELKQANLTDEQKSNVKIGIRDDNKWLLYKKTNIPQTEEQWNNYKFCHSNTVGFSMWPKKFEIYAPYNEQPNTISKRNAFTQEEQEFYNFFANEEKLSKLIKYLSMEERKGKDQFNAYKFLMFKNLFKIFEARLLDPILAHLTKLVQDKTESSQRCAAEILSGLVRGTKHWNYQSLEKMWTRLLPIFEMAIVNMCSEAMSDWGLAMAMALDMRDPIHSHWILEYLMSDDPLKKDSTSFVSCVRLMLLHTALNQQPWRNLELFDRLFEYFKLHLAHPFQNIRDKICTCLIMIFTPRYFNMDEEENDKLYKFVHPTLTQLYNYSLMLKDDDVLNKKMIELELSQDKKDESIRLFKLVAKYMTSSAMRTTNSWQVRNFYEMLPLCCLLQNLNNTNNSVSSSDDELTPICTNLLAILAGSIVMKDNMGYALDAIEKVANCAFWSARMAITEFMSVFVFHNMAIITSKREWIERIQKLVLMLLEDVQPEVRISASQVLSGLLHCQFVPNANDLLLMFKQKAKTKLKKKSNENQLINTLRIRHGAVLGLCSFISSHPYDVPDYLPDIFGVLGVHLIDPQPIPTTIRKTLDDFKRTHHENWEMHKLKFTEDELTVLSDLTVPPSYYA